MPGSAKRQSLHIPAEPELSPRVTSQHEAHLSATGPPADPGPKCQTSSQPVTPGLCSDLAEPDRRSALQVALIYSASRAGGDKKMNRPQISQHRDQTITTNLPTTAPRLAVRHVTYHVY